jgi:hypothetical protein
MSKASMASALALAIPAAALLFPSCPRASSVRAMELSLEEAAAFHESRPGEGGEFLILGKADDASAGRSSDPGLARLAGRWEGYDYGPPVSRDLKIVLALRSLARGGGEALVWAGTNLQYPSAICRERIAAEAGDGRGTPPSIAIKLGGAASAPELELAYDAATDSLRSPAHSERQVALTRSRSFVAYEDYPRYLAAKGIAAASFHSSVLRFFGGEYLVYLPEGYGEDAGRSWPLILFFHGTGDIGENPYLLAKASPFLYIREKGPLGCIIAAPLLRTRASSGFFPDAYLEGALDEILAAYRVDPSRVYATGLSLGGEAVYEIATLRPGAFAAIAPLAAFSRSIPALASVTGMSVLAIHGAADRVVPPKLGRAPAEALAKAGADVVFELLPGHDHDVWTDSYSDPMFYERLLSKRR